MEDVLDQYEQPYDPERPLVCFDETTKQMVRETRTPLPARPGQVERYDYEYERNGVRNLFMFFEPLAGRRQVRVSEHRTTKDFARAMKWLVDEAFPGANQVRLVLDNLNTHRRAALYEAFPPQEASRILKKLEFHYTPKHASWLNMAEIELSIFSRECLDQRIPDEASLVGHLAALETERNERQRKVHWQFTTERARVKLRRLYPSYSG
jgi:hypothetical protein